MEVRHFGRFIAPKNRVSGSAPMRRAGRRRPGGKRADGVAVYRGTLWEGTDTLRSYCLVTGGTRGIGLACVESLSEAGYGVVFCGRDAEAGARVAAHADVHFILADIATVDECRRVAEEVCAIAGGRLAGLINNAGIGSRLPFADTTPELFEQVIGLNLRSAFFMTQFCLPALQAAHGSVVMVSSVAGKVGEEGLSLYTASKAGLIGLTQTLALEIGADVRVNAICPGQIETEMMSRTLALPGRRAALEKRIPAGRLGTPQEVAQAARWLISPESSFVNGAVMTVDGGEIAGIRTPAT